MKKDRFYNRGRSLGRSYMSKYRRALRRVHNRFLRRKRR